MNASVSARILLSAVAVIAVTAAAVPWGHTEDFDTESTQWHGLADFVDLTERQGANVREVSTLHFDQVTNDDVIVLIYPRNQPDTPQIAEFLMDGGRVFLVDDFGASAPLKERLDLERSEPSVDDLPHQQFVDDHPGWPRFIPEGRHPLLEGVDEVVANYPAVLHNVGAPVIGYDGGGGLVYDMELGDGRAVVAADPGLLINSMLPVADNRRLAANAISYLCGDTDECVAWLLVEHAEFSGTYIPRSQQGEGDELSRRIEQFNQGIQEVLSELVESQLLYLAAVIIAAGGLIYLLTVFRWRPARRLSRYIERRHADLAPPLTEFDWNIERFSESGDKINYALPMAILKESFQRLFFAQFDLWPLSEHHRPSNTVVAKRFEERYLQHEPPARARKRRRQLEQLLAVLDEIPDRRQVSIETEQYFTARDLRQLHRRIRQVLRWMGLEELYERRTRDIDDRTLDASGR